MEEVALIVDSKSLGYEFAKGIYNYLNKFPFFIGSLAN